MLVTYVVSLACHLNLRVVWLEERRGTGPGRAVRSSTITASVVREAWDSLLEQIVCLDSDAQRSPVVVWNA